MVSVLAFLVKYGINTCIHNHASPSREARVRSETTKTHEARSSHVFKTRGKRLCYAAYATQHARKVSHQGIVQWDMLRLTSTARNHSQRTNSTFHKSTYIRRMIELANTDKSTMYEAARTDDVLSDDDEDGVPLTRSAKKQRKPPVKGGSSFCVRHKGSICYIVLSLSIVIGASMYYKSKMRFGTENPKPDFHPPGWRDPFEENKNNRSPEPDLSSPVQSPPNDGNADVGKEEWGYWKFYDGGADSRPEGDYCGKYENRDIPGDDFPENAWQTDAVYVNHFLDEALKLVGRTKEAIYAEYGAGEPLDDSKKERYVQGEIDMNDCN